MKDFSLSLTNDSAFSNVNFLDKCKLFEQMIKCLKLNWERWNPSLIHPLEYILINSAASMLKCLGNSILNKDYSSSYPMVKQAYGGAYFVPTAVHKIWLNIFQLKLKLLFFKINSKASQIHSFVIRFGIWFCFFEIQYLIASKSYSVGIEAHKLSILQKRKLQSQLISVCKNRKNRNHLLYES